MAILLSATEIVLKPRKVLEDDMCWLATYKKMGDQILINKNCRSYIYITSCSNSCLAPNEAFVILLHQADRVSYFDIGPFNPDSVLR